MKINIQSPHFTPGKQLLSFVMEKVNILSHFHPGILAGEVCLKLESRHILENKICEIRLIIRGNDLFAERQSEAFEIAIAEAIDALKGQIRKLEIESYGEVRTLQKY
ncbi:MAG: ribosome-associated translation inhibitor RaiA [Bacteroidetes bacterium]|nr:ribosome-associated translation inhibitor RaiA [Bacteroidota bacterium]